MTASPTDTPTVLQSDGQPWRWELPPGLTHVEFDAIQKIQRGEPVVHPPMDVRLNGDADAWKDRTIRSDVLTALVRSIFGRGRHRILLDGVRLVGDLQLAWQAIERPLELRNCRVDGLVDVADATLSELTATDCCLPRGIRGPRITISSCLVLERSDIGCGVNLSAAHVLGDLQLNGVRLSCPGQDGVVLDLEAAEVGGAISLREATSSGTVRLSEATVERSVSCTGSRFQSDAGVALVAKGLRVGADLELNGGFRARGVDLRTATVAQYLNCSGSKLCAPAEAAAFDASSAHVGVINFSDSHVDGGLVLNRAMVVGSVRMNGTRLRGAGDGPFAQQAMVGGDLEIGGDLLMLAGASGHSFHSKGEIRLFGLKVKGQLRATGAHLRGEGRTALVLDGARIGDSVHLDAERTWIHGAPRPFRCSGSIRIVGAEIGRVSCRGAHMEDQGGTALSLKRTTVRGDLLLDWARDLLDEPIYGVEGADGALRFTCLGQLDLRSSRILGSLRLDGAMLSHGEDRALAGYAMQVGLDLTMTVATWARGPVLDAKQNPARTCVVGQLDLAGTVISGNLDLTGCSVSWPNNTALTAYGATITGDVTCAAARVGEHTLFDHDGNLIRTTIRGRVDLSRITIESNLYLRGLCIENTQAQALVLSGTRVERRLRIGPEKATLGTSGPDVMISGETRMLGTQVGSELEIRGAKLCGAETVFNGRDLQVTHSFAWKELIVEGRVDLANASVGDLDDDTTSWPGIPSRPSRVILPDAIRSSDKVNPLAESRRLTLSGFRYRTLANTTSPDVNFRRAWLDGQISYAAEPYRQLSRIYREAGNDREGRRISMELYNATLRRRDGGLPPHRWCLRWLSRLIVGYGYAPARALIWLLAVWLAGCFWVGAALHAGHVVPTKPLTATTSMSAAAPPPVKPSDCNRRDYPCLAVPLYTLDLLAPVVNLGQRDNWRINGPVKYRAAAPVLTVVGWVLTTFVVAGLTTALRRE